MLFCIGLRSIYKPLYTSVCCSQVEVSGCVDSSRELIGRLARFHCSPQPQRFWTAVHHIQKGWSWAACAIFHIILIQLQQWPTDDVVESRIFKHLYANSFTAVFCNMLASLTCWVLRLCWMPDWACFGRHRWLLWHVVNYSLTSCLNKLQVLSDFISDPLTTCRKWLCIPLIILAPIVHRFIRRIKTGHLTRCASVCLFMLAEIDSPKPLFEKRKTLDFLIALREKTAPKAVVLRRNYAWLLFDPVGVYWQLAQSYVLAEMCF